MVMAVLIGVGVCCIDQPAAGAVDIHWAGVHGVDHAPDCDAGSGHHTDQQSAQAVTAQRAHPPTLLESTDDQVDHAEGHQLEVSFSSSTDERRFRPNGQAILLHLSISRT